MDIMKLPISDTTFQVMFEKIPEDVLQKTLKSFEVTRDDYKAVLHDELFIPGMTNELAWQAICFIEHALEDDSIIAKTMNGKIRYCILLAGVYFQSAEG